jgi:hypothetical protein
MADGFDYASGTITTFFARLEANPQGVRQILMDITSIGVDGIALRKEAKRAPPFNAATFVYVANFSAADTVRQVYESLCGKLITISHQGLAYPNVAVLGVEVHMHQPLAAAYFVILPDGTTSTGVAPVRVTAAWQLQYGGTP